jgi:hypothetical protein
LVSSTSSTPSWATRKAILFPSSSDDIEILRWTMGGSIGSLPGCKARKQGSRNRRLTRRAAFGERSARATHYQNAVTCRGVVEGRDK